MYVDAVFFSTKKLYSCLNHLCLGIYFYFCSFVQLLGENSGILIVKILELHEECTMLVALCEQLGGPPSVSPSQSVMSRPDADLKVLFTWETAGYLRGHPQDIIHIFPPW
jgi:hypothetical protein